MRLCGKDKTAVVCSMLLLAIPSRVPARQLQQTGMRQGPSRSPDVRCVLTVPTSFWKGDGPLSTHVRLDNLTDADLDIEIVPEFYLKGSGDEYSSLIDFVHNRALDDRRKPIGGGAAVSIEAVPIRLHLKKHRSSTFQVDLEKGKWDRTISSVWPSFPLRALPPDSYLLRLEFSDASGRLVRSNEVTVTLQRGNSRH